MTTEIINIMHRALSVMIALPFAFQLWTFILCSSYKNAAVNINTTNREIFRSIKLRYTNSAKLNIPLSDTDSFISKYFYGKGGPFRFVSCMERASGLLLCTALLATTALYVRGYADVTRMITIIATSICFYIFRSTLSTTKQMELAIYFTRDYLDNTLKHRLTPSNLRARNVKNDSSDSIETESMTSTGSNICGNINNKVIDSANVQHTATKHSQNTTNIINISDELQNENSHIIEAVLQEFLA